MGDVGACWDNAVVERFFGSLKPQGKPANTCSYEAGRNGLHEILQPGSLALYER